MIIGPIKFNPNDTGREARGANRNFDVDSLVRVINSPSVQEKVKSGDMLGFLGHWPRIKFGMNVGEGGVINGKAVALEPATRVKTIKVNPDGIIEYTIELLDTASGKVAQRLHNSKAGGFSSAFRASLRGAKRFATDFFGFDFVYEPNITSNRGYVLDSVFDSADDVFDAAADYNLMVDSMNQVFDSMQADYDRQADTIQRMNEEIITLQSMLLKKGKTTDAVLDGVMLVQSVSHSNKFDSVDGFLNEELPEFDKPKSAPAKPTAADKAIKSHYGI